MVPLYAWNVNFFSVICVLILNYEPFNDLYFCVKMRMWYAFKSQNVNHLNEGLCLNTNIFTLICVLVLKFKCEFSYFESHFDFKDKSLSSL